MAQTGDTYTVPLEPAHLNWGEYRNSTNRDIIPGEGYIRIPKDFAVNHEIFNSNHDPAGFGYNLFHASSTDGFLENVTLLAQGCSTAGNVYAKQFSVQGDLQMIGAWYANQQATTNNSVKVTWTNENTVTLEII